MNKIDKKFMFVLLSFIIVIGLICITVSICVNSKSKVTFSNNTSLNSGQQSEVAYIFPVDLNKVTKEQLMQIDGIGEKTAQKIIEYRTQIGEYSTLEQLLNVDDIGDKTLEKLKKYLYVMNSSNSTLVTTANTDNKSKKPATEIVSINYPLDINFASYNELLTLAGIGDDKAKKIIDYRSTKGYFYSIEEIMLVDGIGQKTFDEIKSKIKVDLNKLPQKSQSTTTVITENITPSVPSEEIPLNSINVNTATYEELMKIPGIKDYTAKAIVEHRSHEGCQYTSLSEVEMVLSVQKTNQFMIIKKYLTI